jgi:hypothetical protein
MAEDGIIPERYPLIPLPHGGYRQRTRLNVSDSEGTAILYNESLKGGTRLTRNLCALLRRPYILINAAEMSDQTLAPSGVLKFIGDNGIAVLNLGGRERAGGPMGIVLRLMLLVT